MNLIWHIVKKDLIRFRWAIAIWAVSFLYYQLNIEPTMRGRAAAVADYTLRDYLFLFSIITYCVLSVALIVGMVQEDNLVESTVHWRTRPISSTRLLVAKLLLIETLFVLLPLAFVWLKTGLPPMKSAFILREFGFPLLGAVGLSLSFAATAACTKDLGRCIFTWLAVVGAAFLLAFWLGKIAPPLDRHTASQLIAPKMVLILGLSALVGLAVLCSQYLLRCLTLSIALLAGGVLGVAVVGAAWTWNYLR